jgi:hypothetical protein
MPLYLDEIYWNPDRTSEVKEMFKGVLDGSRGFPEGVSLKGGPWASNEEPKIVLVLDIQDHAKTFETFQGLVAKGVIAKRRLTPIVDWASMDGVSS